MNFFIMKVRFLSLLLAFICAVFLSSAYCRAQTLLRVSENKRYLVDADGNPFFWLGDTAWGLFHRTTQETAAEYLDIRKAQGFTIIQASVLAAGYWDGLGPNLYGESPLEYNNPLSPNESFFKHVDWIVNRAGEAGLYIGLLPVWGEYVCPAWHDGPAIFDAATAYAYGTWIGRRYAGVPNIVWILGGDRAADQCGKDDVIVWHELARGIRDADPDHLITYHPNGYTSSSEWFHLDPLFDFNMIETHKFTEDYYRRIHADYLKNMPKPLIQGEPAYEYEVNFRLPDRFFRSQPYWSFLAGARGHTYGRTYVAYLTDDHHPHDWREWASLKDSLETPGVEWLRVFRETFLTLPWWDLIPDNNLIRGFPGEGNEFMAAAFTPDYTHLVVYFPENRNADIYIPLEMRQGSEAGWVNPIDGEQVAAGFTAGKEIIQYKPPGRFVDALLVIRRR